MESTTQPSSINLAVFSTPPTSHLQSDILQADNLQRLREGISIFSFRKKDSTTRVAIGSLNYRYIPFCSPNHYNDLIDLIRTLGRVIAEDEPMSLDKREELEKYIGTLVTIDTTSARSSSPNVQVYFDLVAREWRSYTIGTLLTIFDHR